MRFSQDFIEKVRDANNIGEIIGQYTELKGTGHRLVGRCPFPDHSDKSPSFSVTEDNQLYFCYGCKKGGNVFTFLETFNGMSFPEAVEYLARRSNIPLPEPEAGSPKPRVSTDQKDLYLKINRVAAVYYHHNLKSLPPEHEAQKYLVKRGITPEIVEKFRIGVATDEWQGLAGTFESKGVPLKAAETLGLIRVKKSAPASGATSLDHYVDLYRERLMFPIFSPTSDVIGFGGRTLVDDMRKYINSSDSPVFNKSRVLYGLHETGKFIRAQDEAIVVEGFMDALSLYAAGIKNVVAIQGTAFTPDHAKLIKRYTRNVKMLLDGDAAGVSAAERSLPILLAADLMPKGVIIPDGMDPDDFVRSKGADALRTEIERAPELFNLLLRKTWLANYHGSASEKVQVISEATMALGQMPNKQLMELYLMELARQLDVDLGWVRRAIANTAQANQPRGATVAPGSSAPGPVSAGPSRPQGSFSPQSAASAPRDVTETPSSTQADELTDGQPVRVSLKGAPKEEAFVLSLLVYNQSLMQELADAGADETLKMITHVGVREIMKRAVVRFREKPEGFSTIAASLTSEVDMPAVLASSLAVTSMVTSEGAEKKLMGDYLAALRSRYQKLQTKNLVAQLREKSTPEMLEQVQAIQRDRLGKDE